jgi:ribosome maturation factor RimP
MRLRACGAQPGSGRSAGPGTRRGCTLQPAVHDDLYQLVAPVVEKMGYSVVELHSHRVRETLHVNLVVYTESGVGIDDCSEIYRTLFPRIKLAGDNRDLHLEVSSPGLTRNLKSTEEFAVFTGREVRVLTDEDGEWFGGTIGEVGDTFVVLIDSKSKRQVGFSQIRKARLDFTQEAEK